MKHNTEVGCRIRSSSNGGVCRSPTDLSTAFIFRERTAWSGRFKRVYFVAEVKRIQDLAHTSSSNVASLVRKTLMLVRVHASYCMVT